MNFKIYILFISFLLSGIVAYSQPSPQKEHPYERMLNAQCDEIIKNLELKNKEQEKKFIELYKEYYNELRNERKANGRLLKSNINILSDSQIDSLINDSFFKSKEAIEIKEKYCKKFRSFLSAKQVVTIYRTEADIVKKMTIEFYKRKEREDKTKKTQ